MIASDSDTDIMMPTKCKIWFANPTNNATNVAKMSLIGHF